MSHGGKGDSPRPYSVTQEEFASNWDRIFGKKSMTMPMPGTIGGAKLVFPEDNDNQASDESKNSDSQKN